MHCTVHSHKAFDVAEPFYFWRGVTATQVHCTVRVVNVAPAV